MLKCSHDGCDKNVSALGLCSTHYMRLRRHGLVPIGTRARGSLKERFFRFVEKTDYCWIWTGGKGSKGYGRIQEGGSGSKHLLPHRVSYEIHKGEIPHGYVIMHSCDNPSCVNPDHLSAGTQSQNILDAIKKGRKFIPKSTAKGENHGAAKLKNEDVYFIRDSNLPMNDLIAMFGVGLTAIERIKKRQTWKSLP